MVVVKVVVALVVVVVVVVVVKSRFISQLEPVNPLWQVHFKSLPFNIKQSPPFWHKLKVQNEIAGAVVVVVT